MSNNNETWCLQYIELKMIYLNQGEITNVATLALGSWPWPKQQLAKVWAKNEASESHFMLLGNVGECERMNLHTQVSSTLGVRVPIDSKSSKGNGRGQNLLNRWVSYTIGKLLRLRCLKWFAWPIWGLKTQVMAKRKVRSQIANLTFNH
jgi:hypothetical protein